MQGGTLSCQPLLTLILIGAAGRQGTVELNGKSLKQGDGAAVSDEDRLTVKGKEDAEVLLFDLA